MDVGFKITNADDFINAIMYDSVLIFRDKPSVQEYIDNTEMTTESKVIDIQNLIQWAERMEMYEDCSSLLEIKHKILCK